MIRFNRKPREVDSRFVVEPFTPAYCELGQDVIIQRVEAGLSELEDCCACPRNCHIDRMVGETRVCGTGRYARVASSFQHFGEEDCLRGWNGSGTIFFSLCNLRCVFCQNWDISQKPVGPECPPQAIADLMIGLQERGCHNINFVTPEHVVPQVIEAVARAIARGLSIPIVYNTSAYDSVASLRLLEGLIDIYMPDFKFWRRETARRLGKAKDYPERAREAILEMSRQVGPLRLGADGVARRGLLVRHLVMPGLVNESKAIFRWLADEVSRDTYINIMGQYRPAYRVGQRDKKGSIRHAGINHRPRRDEMTLAYEYARRAGLWRFDERQVFNTL